MPPPGPSEQSFRMLGPLAVERNGVPVSLGGDKPRALLGFLLTRRNLVTSVDSIVEAVWDDDPPPSASAAIQVYVSQVRRALGEPAGRPATLVTAPPGYRLTIGDDACDASRFESLRRRAREVDAVRDPRTVSRLLRLALDEWSGPALADLQHHRFAVEVAAALAEERLTTIEDRVVADLRFGRERELVGELTELTLANPYRETLWEQLVLALYRSGRQTEALSAYQRMRTLLSDELGIDPSPRLRALEAAVLRQDPSLDPSPTTAGAADPPAVVPTLSPPHVVALVLSDVEGSTRLWRRYPDLMPDVMLTHHQLSTTVVAAHGGRLPPDQGEGDSRLAVFEAAPDAMVAAGELQRQLAAADWPGGVRPLVRMAVHAGSVVDAGGNVFGSAVHRCARIRSIAHGGQVVVSATAASLAEAGLPDEWMLRWLGRAAVRDFDDDEGVFQLDRAGERPQVFPALLTSVRLPGDATPFVGRRDEIEELAADVRAHRLVTLTGLGGSGKTRLAVEAARVSASSFPGGAVFVDLSATASDADVHAAIAEALAPAPSPEIGVALRDLVPSESLLVLDNLEQVASTAVVSELLSATTVHLLATSRVPLGVRGEVVRPVAPLSEADAVTLFLERATAATDVEATDADVVALVRLLAGMPLAIELAAARLRVMDLDDLAGAVAQEVDVLSDRASRRPERHRTVTAQLDTAWEGLSGATRHVLVALSTFRSATADEVADVAGVAELAVLDALDELVGRGLTQVERRGRGQRRFRVLGLVRSFVVHHADAERLRACQYNHARVFLGRAEHDAAASPAEREELRAALRVATAADAATDFGDFGEGRRLSLARRALALGWWDEVVALLEPVAASPEAANPLGVGLVRRGGPGDLERGRRLLAKAADAADCDAAAALGGTYKDADPPQARRWYQRALAIDPGDPYPLGNLVELEVQAAGSFAPVAARRDELRAGLALRRAQAARSEDLPWSWFDAAKLALLLGDDAEGMHGLLRAVAAATNVHQLDTTASSFRRLAVPDAGPAWAIAAEILRLGRAAVSGALLAPSAAPPLTSPVVVIAGASGLATHDAVMTWLEPLVVALPSGAGTLVSGGTSQGVSALAAAVAARLPQWRAVGYLPASLPAGAAPDERYDELRRTEARQFGLTEPLAYWSDILASGIRTSDVHVLGVGGTTLTGLELHLAAALGAVLAVGAITGRGTDDVSTPVPEGVPVQLVHPEAGSLRGWLTT